MVKKIKKVLIVLMFVLLATMTNQKVYADFLTDKHFTKSQYSGTFSILMSDLMSNDNWNMLCSEHGQHLPSQNNIDNAYSGDYNSYSDLFNTINWIKSYSSTNSTCEYAGKFYHADKGTAYKVTKDNNVCTPKAAYVLNNMQEGVNSYGEPNNYTDIQKAWYNVVENGDNTSKIYTEATAYENFIKKIVKDENDISNVEKYVDVSHNFGENQNVTIKFPEIDTKKIRNMISFNTVIKNENGEYKVEQDEASWASNVTVNFDTKRQKYIIGPFSINYIEASSGNVDFGAINGFNIYTDASSEPVASDKWKFEWVEKNRDNMEYPHNDEVFYIEMDYIKNATMITGMDVDYKYLIAGAEYQTLEGTYDQYIWKVKCDKKETIDEEGNKKVSYKWYFKNTQKILAKKAQKLALADKAARWYETTKIQARVPGAKILIKKVAKDENGNILTADQIKERFGEYQYFDFKVKITHSDGEVEYDDVTVRAGSSTLAGPYKWKNGEEPPKYEVEEIPPVEPWKFVSIENGQGSLKSGDPVHVIAENKLIKPHENKIHIVKTINHVAEEDKPFEFIVTVTMPDGTKQEEVIPVTVKKGKKTGEGYSKTYEWYGDENPTYEIVEKETEISKKYACKIVPGKGEIKPYKEIKENIKVYAYNETEVKKLELNKWLANGPAEKDETFKFRLTITESDGTVTPEILTVVVPKGSIKSEKPAYSKEYYWNPKTEKAPTFYIEEIEKPIEYDKVVITPSSGSFDEPRFEGINVRVDAVNYKGTTPFQSRIELTKMIKGAIPDKDTLFEFEVTVTENDGTVNKEIVKIPVKKGEKISKPWYSKWYKWDEGEQPPYYKVVEINYDKDKYTASITNGEGYLSEKQSKAEILAINESGGEDDASSFLTIEKKLKDGQTTADTFDFRITVDGVKNTEIGKIEFEALGLKADEKAGPFEFIWADPNVAPTYTVEEINVDSEEAKVSLIEEIVNATSRTEKNTNKISGKLVKEGETNLTEIKFTNDMTEHKGGIKVIKDIETEEKISKETLEADGTKFEIEVVVEGTFKHNGKSYQDTTMVITKNLPEDGKWEFEINDIIWYGSKAPTFTVREKNLPTGWRCKSITYSDLENESTSTEGHNLMLDKTIEAKIINELPTEMIIDLTFSMAGLVWVDDTLFEKEKDEYINVPNGVYDEGETLKENAEVIVYRVVYDASENEVGRTIAQAYKDINNNEVQFPILTKSDGKWDVPRISVPALTEEEQANGYSVGYDVEFVYDGQNYEPTEFLSYKISPSGERTKLEGSNESRVNGYKDAAAEEKDDEYARDSMALEVNDGSKKVIAEVSGKTEIDANGNTTGIVTFNDGTQSEITYSSDNAGAGYPTISKLNTTDSNGKVLDIFKAKARTSIGHLIYPFNKDDYDGSTLASFNKTIDENGVHKEYKFIAVYNHCLNINLGLKQRATMDIGLTKKLDNAKVVVNEKLYQYNYSGNYDLTEQKINSLDKDVCVNNIEDIEYKLGLYKTDYYYRAEMYKNSETYAGKTIYQKMIDANIIPEDREMDIYLTYKIKMENSSSKYDVRINSLDDYYDSNFTLVKGDETKYIKTRTIAGNQEEVNDKVIIATGSQCNWETVKTGIVGSDKDAEGNNIIYNKMTANNLNIVLAPGEEKEINVTFKLNKENLSDAKNAIALGQKCNVAEIASYSTLYAGTQNYAGIFDRDSAPSNINISASNSKAWYEDDTFAAPRLKLELYDTNRQINGLAWEDNSKDENTENPGYNQQVGNGIMDSGEGTIEGLTTELVEKVMIPNSDGTYTEYDYTWSTDKALDSLNGKTIEQVSGFDSTITTDNKGEYSFNNVAAGDYVVRFTYGDEKIESKDYSEAEYYNGQDYKSTKYKAIVKDGATTKVEPSKYLDLKAISKTDKHYNTAVDSEVRRLQVIQNSREITYDNNIVMAEYQDKLFEDYYMFADTPKLNMNIELSGNEESNRKYRHNEDNKNYNYDVNKVSFGLEERPSTKLTLDKQIEEIILTTSDERTIMDAKYNIDYVVEDDGSIRANVELDTENSYGIDNLQALNRDLAVNQGFRYINVDSNILNGAIITVKYRFTVLNTGEVDRTGELANMNYKEDNTTFVQACNDLSTKLVTYRKEGDKLVNNTALGYYVGSIYYYGAEGNQSDKVVTSTVRKLVDYIDNDVIFSEGMNSTKDTSWRNKKTSELKQFINDEIITTTDDGKEVILDRKGVQYETENRNNLVVSVDSEDKANSINNSGFIVELLPEAVGNGTIYESSMNLTVTKYIGADSDDLQIDNIAEIIKYNNKVGRRDELTIAGNQIPAEALETDVNITTGTTLSAGMKYERDTSATEIITLSPPTGTELMTWKLQVIASVTVGLVIVAGGIVLIKKKVLK